MSQEEETTQEPGAPEANAAPGTHLFKVDVYVASGRWAYRRYCQERVGGVPGEVGGRAGCIWSFDSVVKIQRHDDAQTQSGVTSAAREHRPGVTVQNDKREANLKRPVAV